MGGVTVALSHVGLAMASDGAVFHLDGDITNGNATSLFPVWTITFDGACSFDESAWASCPANTGDLEVRIVLSK